MRIIANPSNIGIGDNVELTCLVDDQPAVSATWTRVNSNMPFNAQPRGNVLKLFSLQANNGGIYRCKVTTASGVFEKEYALVIEG